MNDPASSSETSLTPELTAYLRRWQRGEGEAFEKLIELVYSDLRRTAGFYLSKEREDHTLQPTALIHEIYLRLHKSDQLRFENRTQFFAFAGRLMRQVLVESARMRNSAKRPNKSKQVDEEALQLAAATLTDPEVLIDVDRALTRLESEDPRQAQIVELRFFAGMSFEEVAEALSLSESTIKREWRLIRLWFSQEMRGHEPREAESELPR